MEKYDNSNIKEENSYVVASTKYENISSNCDDVILDSDNKLLEYLTIIYDKLILKNVDILKEDYIDILKILKTPLFTEIINNLLFDEFVIMSLMLASINGKYSSTSSISEYLGIEEKKVVEVIKKVLIICKENIDSSIESSSKNFKLSLGKK